MSEKVGDVEVLVGGGGSDSCLDVGVTDSTSTTASIVSTSASSSWHKAKLTLQVGSTYIGKMAT